MTSAGMVIDPWPLLRNDASDGGRHGLHLVVHGRSGGVVPECLASLPDLLAQRRSAPVQLEVLTAEQPVSALPQSSWIVPLLLLPGAHARTDVPAIRNRLRGAGASVRCCPFWALGPRGGTLCSQHFRRLSALMPCWCTTPCARGWRIASSRCWRLAWLCRWFPLMPGPSSSSATPGPGHSH